MYTLLVRCLFSPGQFELPQNLVYLDYLPGRVTDFFTPSLDADKVHLKSEASCHSTPKPAEPGGRIVHIVTRILCPIPFN